ncbi:MAG: 3-dehydroquinate synthase [Thermoflexales bacterium]
MSNCFAPRSLVIAGFMGVGKSTVGRLCAQQLGLGFVDTDAEIARREGMSVRQIFERHGEPYFREREAALAAELSEGPARVIATGGGMVLNDAVRRRWLRSALTVQLTATPAALLRRLGANAAAERPLLRGDDLRQRIAELLRERAPKYAELHYHLDTTSLNPAEVAAQLVRLYRAEQARIHVCVGPEYDVVIGSGLLDHLGAMLAGRGFASTAAVVADAHVMPLFGKRVEASLQQAGFHVTLHTMPAGEAHKNLASVEAIYAAFSAAGLERRSVVIALGGGVVGDTAGFAAATYLRGVPLVQVPTTLLAMADSSIGGKTGVDTPFGKNLVGAFKQPELVVIDLEALRTLPMRELRSGLAEVIKAALIAGGEPFARLQALLARSPLADLPDDAPALARWQVDDLMPLLHDAIQLKRQVVEADPHEVTGARAVLNLGHTFGHAIEAWSGFRLRHGEAIALGLMCAARLSEQLGHGAPSLTQTVVALLRAVGLPVDLCQARAYLGDLSFDVEAVWRYMQSDKKKADRRLRFVLLRQPGDVRVEAVHEAEARAALSAVTSAHPTAKG